MDWTLANIRDQVRKLTGRSDIADSDLNDYVNRFYQDEIPILLNPNILQGIFEANTVQGVGEYGLDPKMRAVYPPAFVDETKVMLTRDSGFFFSAYPDRENQNQGQPECILYFENALWVAPIPDGEYTIRVHALYKPDALVADSDMPIVPSWGKVIAYGAAAQVFVDDGDYESAQAMQSLANVGLGIIARDDILDWRNMRSVPRF